MGKDMEVKSIIERGEDMRTYGNGTVQLRFAGKESILGVSQAIEGILMLAA